MRNLLVMAVVSMLALWGCAVEDSGSQVKYGNDDNGDNGDPARPSGKHYFGVSGSKPHAIGCRFMRGGHEPIEGAKTTDIYVELDFRDDDLVVSVKNSAKPHECDQSPPGAIKRDSDGDDRWKGKWTNDKSQVFDILVDHQSDGTIHARVHVVYSTMIAGKQQERYQGLVGTFHHENDEQSYAEKKAAIKGNEETLAELKKKFGSGDNCGGSDSGRSGTGNH